MTDRNFRTTLCREKQSLVYLWKNDGTYWRSFYCEGEVNKNAYIWYAYVYLIHGDGILKSFDTLQDARSSLTNKGLL